MTDLENAFGYDSRLPEDIREIFMWLCQDVAALQSKWDFYLKLYGEEDNTALLSELALSSFKIIEESLRNDMTMAICRLSDPSATRGKENLSLATLVKKCRDVPDLDQLLSNFQLECEPMGRRRNKKVGHNDLHTRISPRKNPLPGISPSQIDRIIGLASGILQTVNSRYSDSEFYFHTISRGGADELIFWLKAGREHHTRAKYRFNYPTS